MSGVSPFSNLTRPKHQVVPWFSLTLKFGTFRAYLRTKIPCPAASGPGALSVQCRVKSSLPVDTAFVCTFVNQDLNLGIMAPSS